MAGNPEPFSKSTRVLAFNVMTVPVGGLQVRKKLDRALNEWFQGARCPRFVLFGPGRTGKSTLAVKFAAGGARRRRAAAGVCGIGVEHGGGPHGAARSVPCSHVSALACACQRRGLRYFENGALRSRVRAARALTHSARLCASLASLASAMSPSQ